MIFDLLSIYSAKTLKQGGGHKQTLPWLLPHKVSGGPFPGVFRGGEVGADGGAVLALAGERRSDGVDGGRLARPHSAHQ